MELKKCERCQKVFLGAQGLQLCPICAVAEKSNELIARRQPERIVRNTAAPALAAAR